MFDDLREQSDDTGFEQPKDEGGASAVRLAYRSDTRLLGMTAPQRFVIALMLLIMVCLLGSFCLLIFQKVVPPFLS